MPRPHSDSKLDSKREYTRKSYHGPHFEKGPAQEELWHARGSTQVWDPNQTVRSEVARPETYGRAHSISQSRIEAQISEPYEKRPNPWTARMEAEQEAYHRPSDGRRGMSDEVKRANKIKVNRYNEPKDSDRDGLSRGRDSANAGRKMANEAVQGREGFIQKYPQAYDKIATHNEQVQVHRKSAANYRESEEKFEKNLQVLEDKRKERRSTPPGRS